jgi:hypothetical protein
MWRTKVKIKPFYMQPNPDNEDTVLCADLIAPEGYGEIIGGMIGYSCFMWRTKVFTPFNVIKSFFF